MEKIVTLNYYYSDNPQWWLNFKDSLPLIKNYNDWYIMICYHLKEYNAIYLCDRVSDPLLVFDSEEDYTFFVLKWS